MVRFANFSKQMDNRPRRLDECDLLRQRMSLLKPQDRILLELHLENNASFQQLSYLVGVNSDCISRRIKKMTTRLLNDKYLKILRHKACFTDQQLNIAYDHYLLGQGRRTISLKRHLPTRTVYHELCYLRDWLKKM